MSVRVLVTGGRAYPNEEKVHSALNKIHGTIRISHLINGGAEGADGFARSWAARNPDVKLITEKAQWDRHGKSAGPKRNQKMLTHAPDIVLVFPGGKGTADMRKRALGAELQVMDFHDDK